MNFTGYFLTTRNEFDFLHHLVYWEVNKTKNNDVTIDKDIHENILAPDPLTHWQNDNEEAANHTTLREVVD